MNATPTFGQPSVRKIAPVRTGLDRIAAGDVQSLRGKRVALLSNQATVTADFVHAADLLHSSGHLTLVRLFAPEHGFRGELQDMAAVGHSIDGKTQLPIISLYGSTEDSLAPRAADLKDIDALVVDLPDIGTRYYTFAQTLAYSMRAAAAAGVEVVVLDRPNPLNGTMVEGSPLLKSCRSFCGYAPVPQRHGLSLGELATLMNHGFGTGEDAVPALGCALTVLECEGWSRGEYFDETGLPWVLPSPNMPTLDTAIVYPGACLFETTNASEGRGTTRPFEFLGAPYADSDAWIEATLQAGFELKGARLRPIGFQPKFQKWRDELCAGVQIHVTDRKEFQPLRWGLALVAGLKRTAPSFAWRQEAYEFISSVSAIDLLYGSSTFRTSVDSGASLAPLETELAQFERRYLSDRTPFLRY